MLPRAQVPFALSCVSRLTYPLTTVFSYISSRPVSSTSSSSFAASATPKKKVKYHALIVQGSGPQENDVVRKFAARIVRLGGSIEESRMSALGGEFSFMALVNIPTSVSSSELNVSLTEVLPEYTVSSRNTSQAMTDIREESQKILTMELEGPAQSSILKALTSILFKHDVSIRELDTDTSNAPFAGYRITSLKSVLAVPLSADFLKLESDLTDFEEKYGVRISMEDPSVGLPSQGEHEEEGEDGEGDEIEDDGEEAEEMEEEEHQQQQQSSRPRRIVASTAPARK